MEAPLPCSWIIAKAIDLQKVSVSDMQNLRFLNTLSADGQYSVFNTANLTQRIQMQVSRKQQTATHFFSAFLKSSLNFEHFQKKDDSHS